MSLEMKLTPEQKKDHDKWEAEVQASIKLFYGPGGYYYDPDLCKSCVRKCVRPSGSKTIQCSKFKHTPTRRVQP